MDEPRERSSVPSQTVSQPERPYLVDVPGVGAVACAYPWQKPRNCSVCHSPRLPNGHCSNGDGSVTGCPCPDQSFDLRVAQGIQQLGVIPGRRGAPSPSDGLRRLISQLDRDALLIQLIYAARHLAGRRIGTRPGFSQGLEFYCRDCGATARDEEAIHHERICPVGRVFTLLAELQLLSQSHSGKEALAEGTPLNTGTGAATPPASERRFCVQCGRKDSAWTEERVTGSRPATALNQFLQSKPGSLEAVLFTHLCVEGGAA